MRAVLETLTRRHPDRSEETVVGQGNTVILHAIGAKAASQTTRFLTILGATNSPRGFRAIQEVFPLLTVSGIPEKMVDQTQLNLEVAFGKKYELLNRLTKPAPEAVINNPEKTADKYAAHIRKEGNSAQTMLHFVKYDYNSARTAEDNSFTNANVIQASLQEAKRQFPNLFHLVLLTFSRDGKIYYNEGSKVFPQEEFDMPVIVAETEPESEEETALLQGIATLMAGVDAKDTGYLSPTSLQNLGLLTEKSTMIGTKVALSDSRGRGEWDLYITDQDFTHTAKHALQPEATTIGILTIALPIGPKHHLWSDQISHRYMSNPTGRESTQPKIIPIYVSSSGNCISAVHFFPAT